MITLRINDAASPAASAVRGDEQIRADGAFRQVWSQASAQRSDRSEMPSSEDDGAEAFEPAPIINEHDASEADLQPTVVATLAERKDLQGNWTNSSMASDEGALANRAALHAGDRWSVAEGRDLLATGSASDPRRHLDAPVKHAQMVEQTGRESIPHKGHPSERERLARGAWSAGFPHVSAPARSVRADSEANAEGVLRGNVMQGHPVAKGGIGGGIQEAGVSFGERVLAPTERAWLPMLRHRHLETGSERGHPIATPGANTAYTIGHAGTAAAGTDLRAAELLRPLPNADEPGELRFALLTETEAAETRSGAAPDMFKAGAERLKMETLVWPSRVRMSHFQTDIRAPMAALVAGGGASSAQIMLDPVELGLVRISLHPGDTGLQVQVLVERAETLDLMRRFAHELARDLARLGFDDVAMDFSHTDQRDGFVPKRAPDQPSGTDLVLAESHEQSRSQPLPQQGNGMDLRL